MTNQDSSEKTEEMKIIAIVGPESTGKSDLSKQLATHFEGSFVPEFARQYLNERGGRYSQNDLIEIAHGQLTLEQKVISEEKFPVFCDTDIVVIKVWHEFKYGEPEIAIDELLAKQAPRSYLLTFPDLPWEADPLRENPNNRMELFNRYESLLQSMQVNYRIVKGIGPDRLNCAIQALDKMKFG